MASFPAPDRDRKAADRHALERARLGAAGGAPPFVDGRIAATASVNDPIPITANAGDFERFQGLRARSRA